MLQFRILQNRVCNKLFDQAARLLSSRRLLDVITDKWIVGKLVRDIACKRSELSSTELSYRINFLCQGNICRSVYAQYALQARLDGAGNIMHGTPQEMPQTTQMCALPSDAIVSEHDRCRLELLSCGTATRAGKPAEPAATDVAKEFGVDLSQHAATCADEDVITSSDLILFMDAEQFVWLFRMWWRLKWVDFSRKYLHRVRWGSCSSSFYRSCPRPFSSGAGASAEGLVPRKMPFFLPLGVFSLRGGYRLTIRDPFGKDREVFVTCFQQINCALDGLVEVLHSSVRLDNSQK